MPKNHYPINAAITANTMAALLMIVPSPIMSALRYGSAQGPGHTGNKSDFTAPLCPIVLHVIRSYNSEITAK